MREGDSRSISVMIPVQEACALSYARMQMEVVEGADQPSSPLALHCNAAAASPLSWLLPLTAGLGPAVAMGAAAAPKMVTSSEASFTCLSRGRLPDC